MNSDSIRGGPGLSEGCSAVKPREDVSNVGSTGNGSTAVGRHGMLVMDEVDGADVTKVDVVGVAGGIVAVVLLFGVIGGPPAKCGSGTTFPARMSS